MPSKVDSDEPEFTPAYVKATKISQGLITCEVAVTALLTFLVYLHLKAPLWDQFYLELVLADWQKGPIVQLKTISPDEDCDESSMLFTGSEVSFNAKYETAGNSEFEILG